MKPKSQGSGNIACFKIFFVTALSMEELEDLVKSRGRVNETGDIFHRGWRGESSDDFCLGFLVSPRISMDLQRRGIICSYVLYLEYHIVCLLVRTGSPAPSPAGEWGGGGGGGRTLFGRLERKPGTLVTLLLYST